MPQFRFGMIRLSGNVQTLTYGSFKGPGAASTAADMSEAEDQSSSGGLTPIEKVCDLPYFAGLTTAPQQVLSGCQCLSQSDPAFAVIALLAAIHGLNDSPQLVATEDVSSLPCTFLIKRAER